MNLPTTLASLAVALLCTPALPQQPPQQVIQVGTLNAPAQVFTPDAQWSNLLGILSLPDVDFYIEDPSTDAWLARNGQAFLDRGHYTITVVSYYRTPRACRADQIRSGFSDGRHADACDHYRYRIRQIAVDAPQNAITLLFSAMVFSGGALDPGSVARDTRTRGFHELDNDSQKALSDATKLVAQQTHLYAIRNHLIH